LKGSSSLSSATFEIKALRDIEDLNYSIIYLSGGEDKEKKISFKENHATIIRVKTL
jgi:hypothetical protein